MAAWASDGLSVTVRRPPSAVRRPPSALARDLCCRAILLRVAAQEIHMVGRRQPRLGQEPDRTGLVRVTRMMSAAGHDQHLETWVRVSQRAARRVDVAGSSSYLAVAAARGQRGDAARGRAAGAAEARDVDGCVVRTVPNQIEWAADAAAVEARAVRRGGRGIAR